MNVYFEFDPSVIKTYGLVADTSCYYVAYGVRKSAVIGGTRYRGMFLTADRVWAEEDGQVRYLKYRHGDPGLAQVDVKEFFWIKLKAEAV
jgi:hypothetical protein